MLFKKQGFPEEGEILICNVKKILPHSIFVDIIEYKDREGYIHISEIAPGRIRNIRDYVKEGKKIVCKVLDINQEKGYIDLSLRRVSENVKLAKIEEFKQEEKAEKILESVAKKLNISLEDIYKKINPVKILDRYGLLYSFLQEVSLNGESVLKALAIPQDISKELLIISRDKIKRQEVHIDYNITLTSAEPNGVSIVKDTLAKAESLAKEQGYNARLRYISAPKYMLVVTSKDFKTCERIGNELGNFILASIKSRGQGSIEKIDR